MGLENTDQTWEGRRHVVQWHRAPCLVQRASQEYRKRKRAKDRMEMMDMLGSIVVVAVGGKTGIYAGQKATEFSQLFIWKQTVRHRRTQSNCIWVWSGFCFSPQKQNKKSPPVLHVWPYAKSQAKEAERRNSLGAKRGRGGNKEGGEETSKNK